MPLIINAIQHETPPSRCRQRDNNYCGKWEQVLRKIYTHKNQNLMSDSFVYKTQATEDEGKAGKWGHVEQLGCISQTSAWDAFGIDRVFPLLKKQLLLPELPGTFHQDTNWKATQCIPASSITKRKLQLCHNAFLPGRCRKGKGTTKCSLEAKHNQVFIALNPIP